MPVPLIIIGGAAAVSIGSTVHSTWKSRKWKKIHAEALENFKATGGPHKACRQQLQRLGRRVREVPGEQQEAPGEGG